MKGKLFYLFILIAAGILIVVSLTAVDKSKAIMAVVESQKTALSYHKPVTIKAIHVGAGQQITKGQLLLEVDRPDLNLDYEKLITRKNKAVAARSGLNSTYTSKLELLKIEETGKIARLNAEIGQLESEIVIKNSLRRNMTSLADSSSIIMGANQNDPDSILLDSYKKEKGQIAEHYRTERQRLKLALGEEERMADLELKLIEREIAELSIEEGELKKYAPFDGTIGNVNGQLEEIVPAFQTILSLYEKRPSTIKAYISNNSQFRLNVGTDILVESTTREYSAQGSVIEIGARIVSYQNPGSPPGLPDLYGREVFIKLPLDNDFLYGEQVYIYPNID